MSNYFVGRSSMFEQVIFLYIKKKILTLIKLEIHELLKQFKSLKHLFEEAHSPMRTGLTIQWLSACSTSLFSVSICLNISR